MADRLTMAGVARGDIVGVCVGRSPEFVVAVLAILRCGAAYAPLPTDYPLSRLLVMVDDVGMRVVLVDRSAGTIVAGLRRERAGLVEVAVDADSTWNAEFPKATRSEPDVDPEDPAYVIFTSGSTGRPRGVVIPHRAVAGLVLGQSYADFGPGLRTLLLAPTAFDASTFETWAPLLHGGTVVVYPDRDFDPIRLGEVVRAGRVNCLWLTSGLFNLVVDLEPTSLAGVAHVLTGGDVLSVAHVRRAFAAVPGIRITNGYGPTETTTFACTHAIDPDDPFPEGTIPIGRALAHTECLVVDEQGNPVADGREGELWIGGSGVALGYLSGDRTKFVPDPRGVGSDLWYRSGDRCRWRSDGTLLFLGRVDRQVKIRGHRVEPAELEAAVVAHPAIRGAAVLPFRCDDETALAVFVIRRDGAVAAIEGLRPWLATTLPAPMMPARIVTVTAFPVTTNGKLDRDALLARLEPDAGPRTTRPLSGTESRLASLWRDLLGGASPSRDDDFFDMGGNSLAAMRLVARIERWLGFRLPVREVFDHPRLADLAAAIDGAGPDRRIAPSKSDAKTLEPMEAPALPAQRGMWALHDHLPDRATYNQPFAYRVGAAIDLESLRRVLTAVMSRHPSLRSALVPSTTGLIQRVATASDVTVTLAVEPGVGLDSIDAALRDHARRPFDLATPPLWRVAFFPDAAPHGVILFVFHHAIVDHWSLVLFFEEITALSSGMQARPPAPYCRVDPPAGARRECLLRYWRRELARLPAAVRLPGAKAVEGEGTSGAVLRQSLPGLAAALRKAACSNRCTLAQWLVAVFHSWLQRISVATDAVVVTPMSLRAMGVAEDAFGCYLNTVPIRVRWTDEGNGLRPPEGMTLRALAGKIRRTMIDAAEHADLPFDEIVATAGRSGRHGGPIADLLVVVTEGGPPTGRFGDAVLEPRLCNTATAKFGATFFFDVSGDDVDLAIEYATVMYDETLVAAHLSTLAAFLDGAIHDPGAAIDSLPLAEPSRVCGSGAVSIPARRAPRPIHLAAISHARITPDLAAVIAGPCVLSYADLDERSRALAAHLTELGAVAGERVGICLTRGASSCVALLGVLRAGGACVPLDPVLPSERHGRMVTIAGVRFVVYEEATAAVVQAIPGVIAVQVGGHPPAPRFVDPPVAVESLAYVLFTSGSTGEPKGVEMPHGPLASLFDWQIRSTPRAQGDRTLHFASIGFDVAFQELFSAWWAGCTVVVADDRCRLDPAQLLDLVVESEIDRVFLPTAMLIPFAEAALVSGRLPRNLRDVIVAGERLRVTDTVRRLFATLLECRLWNHYGPTETHVVTAHLLQGAPDAWPDDPPIGLPIDGVEVMIVGPDGGRLPAGCIGEIILGGGCLARGYASRPDLTAECFRFDIGATPGGRTYRTGDLGWIRPDGVIECVGRTDRQVKISGHRIEPGEVEAALAACIGVRRAVVSVRRDDGSSTSVRLVAFLEVGPEWPGRAATRARLGAMLSEPMIPAVLVPLETLPTNLNGKIDHQRLAELPIMDHADERPAAGTDPPRGEFEAIVAQEWSRILGVPRVSRDDDFFALGGRSLPAMILVAAIHGRFGVRLPVRTVFESSRLSDMAAAIEFAVNALPSAARGGVNEAGHVPALPAQRGMWVLQHLLPDPATYNQPYAFRPRGPVDWEDFRRRLGAVMARHSALRTALVESGGAVVQRIVPADGIDVPWEEDATVGPDRIEEALATRAREPFQLDAPPLWRAILFPAAASHGVILLLFHHAIIDDWSIGLLLRELGADAPPNEPAPLATFPLRGDREAARRHWHRILDGAPPAVPWPGAHVVTGPPTGRGALVQFHVPAHVVAAWEQVARSRRATLFHAWLAACHLWLQDATGSRDTVVLTPLANRADGATVDAVGCLINMVPVRLHDVPDGATVADVTSLTRSTFLDAIEHGVLSFDEIVATLPGAGGSRLQPLGNVTFVLLERDGHEPSLQGVDLEPVEVHNGLARFDLTLSLLLNTAAGDARGVVEYSLDVLDEATVRMLVDRFGELLARVAAKADLDVGTRADSRGRTASGDAPLAVGTFRGIEHDAIPVGGPPRGATEGTIARLWSEALGGIVVCRDDHFFHLGGNSLLAIRLAHAMTREFGVSISIRALFLAPRLADLAVLVDETRRGTDQVSMAKGDTAPVVEASHLPGGGALVPLQPLGHRTPIVLCHGVGGGLYHFLPALRNFGSDIPVWGILARDFGDGAADAISMRDLVTSYADEIERFRSQGPVILGGLSLGGWYAWEVARELRRRGREIGTVILLDTHPRARLPWMTWLRLVPPSIATIVARNLLWVGEVFRGHVPRTLRHVLRHADVPPATPPLRAEACPVDRFIGLVECHHTRPCEGRVDLVHSRHPSRVVVPHWRLLAGAGLRVHPFPGDHHQIHLPEFADTLASLLRAIVDDVEMS